MIEFPLLSYFNFHDSYPLLYSFLISLGYDQIPLPMPPYAYMPS